MTVERRLIVVVDKLVIALRTKTTFKIFRRHLGKLMSRLNKNRFRHFINIYQRAKKILTIKEELSFSNRCRDSQDTLLNTVIIGRQKDKQTEEKEQDRQFKRFTSQLYVILGYSSTHLKDKETK